MRRPEEGPRQGFGSGSTSGELLQEFFDRIEHLTARLDQLSHLSGSQIDGHDDAFREASKRRPNRLATHQRQLGMLIDTTDASSGPALDGPARMQAVGSGPRGHSPYLDAEGASDYLGITLKSLYGIVERGRLVPLRGPKRRYRFTEAMLDEYLRRKGGEA